MNEQLNRVLHAMEIDEALIDEILSLGRLKKVTSGDILIDKYSTSTDVPIVIEGILKVSRHDKDDNVIFLYFLEKGETCAMSISCCIKGKRAAFHVTAEEDCLLWMIPMEKIDLWVEKYPSFRKFIFLAYQARFDELLTTIDGLVFSKLDQRVYNYLLDVKEVTGSYQIHRTHEQIANELNTSRVVVSRLLKKLEKEQKIEQYRNRIDIL